MKIALAQLNYLIGGFEWNFEKIKKAVETAKTQGADIVVFGELAVCGYPPRDFLEFGDFIERCHAVLDQIKEISDGIGIVVGCPTVNPVPEGKDLYNSAYFIADGEIKHVQHKTLLPTYDIFDEYRYFEINTSFEVLEYKGKRIALTVCEDIWDIANNNPLYRVIPMDEMMKHKPDMMLNISASPFDYSHAKDRLAIVKANAERYGVPIFYTNHVGSQTEVIFDGGSIAMAANGQLHAELPYFEECVQTFDTEEMAKQSEPAKGQPKDKIKLINDALVTGVRDYFGKLGFKRAILGLSGGIDSAVTLYLAAEALGAENVRAILMPSQYSSDHSVNDSVILSENLGCPYDTIPIESVFHAYVDVLKPYFEGKGFNVTEENIQARIRGNYLMALSNKLGYIVLNTSNKSEAAVGYGTLYGDMCGGLSVIGDVYKMDVYALARYANRNGEVIPENIITKAPSAELRPDQKDSDSLPDYAILDEILYQYIEKRKGPRELIDMGHDPALVKRILRLVNMSEYKRYQTPPMLRVSSKAFGMGRRLPIVGKYLS